MEVFDLRCLLFNFYSRLPGDSQKSQKILYTLHEELEKQLPLSFKQFVAKSNVTNLIREECKKNYPDFYKESFAENVNFLKIRYYFDYFLFPKTRKKHPIDKIKFKPCPQKVQCSIAQLPTNYKELRKLIDGKKTSMFSRLRTIHIFLF